LVGIELLLLSYFLCLCSCNCCHLLIVPGWTQHNFFLFLFSFLKICCCPETL
jgi:hypothetical protein